MILGNVGAVLWRAGKLKEAIGSLEKCLEIQEHLSPTKKTEVAKTLYSLGLARILQCDFGKALEALTRAENILLSVHGESHVEVARIEDALGKCFVAKGDPFRAMEYYSKALKIKTSLFGERNSSVLSTKMNIAAAYRSRHDLDEALIIYREVLGVQKLNSCWEVDQDSRKQLTEDITTTLQMITEVQREKMNYYGGINAIREEKKESENVHQSAKKVWDSSHSIHPLNKSSSISFLAEY